MKAIDTYVAVDLCRKDIADANRTLRYTQLYAGGELD